MKKLLVVVLAVAFVLGLGATTYTNQAGDPPIGGRIDV